MTYATMLADAINLCRDNLRPDLDPVAYATAIVDALPDEPDGSVHVEIRGIHTRTGNPVTGWIG